MAHFGDIQLFYPTADLYNCCPSYGSGYAPFLHPSLPRRNSPMDYLMSERRPDCCAYGAPIVGRKRRHGLDSALEEIGRLMADCMEQCANESEGNKQEDAETEGENPPKKLRLELDVSEFKPEEITIITKDGMLHVSVEQKRETEFGKSYRSFRRSIKIPKEIDIDSLKSVLSPSGVLRIEGNSTRAAITSSASTVAVEEKETKKEPPTAKTQSKSVENSNSSLFSSVEMETSSATTEKSEVAPNVSEAAAENDEATDKKCADEEQANVISQENEIQEDSEMDVLEQDEVTEATDKDASEVVTPTSEQVN